MSTLTLDHISFRYGRTRALDGVTGSVDARGIALLGPNGAGKSTLMRLLTTQVPLQDGSFTVAGRSVSTPRDVKEYRRSLGTMPQSMDIFGAYTCTEFLNYVAWLRLVNSAEVERAVSSSLEAVGLGTESGTRVKALSGGMRQRLGLAQALVNDPEILFLDEPTVGLDPQQRAGFRALLEAFSRDRIVFFSTHLVEDVAAIADAVLVLEGGRLRFCGSIGQLCGLPDGTRPTGPQVEAAYLAAVG